MLQLAGHFGLVLAFPSSALHQCLQAGEPVVFRKALWEAESVEWRWMGETSLRPSIGWLLTHGNWSLMSERAMRVCWGYPVFDLLCGESTQSKSNHYSIPPTPYSSFRMNLLSQNAFACVLTFQGRHAAGMRYSLKGQTKHGCKRHPTYLHWGSWLSFFMTKEWYAACTTIVHAPLERNLKQGQGLLLCSEIGYMLCAVCSGLSSYILISAFLCDYIEV